MKPARAMLCGHFGAKLRGRGILAASLIVVRPLEFGAGLPRSAVHLDLGGQAASKYDKSLMPADKFCLIDTAP